MNNFIRIVPPNGAVEILGVKLVGVTAENGKKLLFSLAFILLTLMLSRGLRWLTAILLRGRRDQRVAFWTRQAIHLVTTILLLMGQPPAVQNAEPAMWVHSRQYTGRVVTVSNSEIFDEPVYNYNRDFPYIWEEMTLPITYTADRARAERILLEVAARHTVLISEMGEPALVEMERRYFIRRVEMTPKVYCRLTDNWLELTVRFIARDHGTRELKDAMSREILAALDVAGIGIASSTFEVVGLPPLRLELRTSDRWPGLTAPTESPHRSRTVGPAGVSTKRSFGRHQLDFPSRLQIGRNRWMNGALAGSTYLPTMDRDDQTNAVGNYQTSIEREIDPVADHRAIDHLATGTRKGEDKEPERRARHGFMASLPLSERLNPESWKQEKGTTPTDQLADVHRSCLASRLRGPPLTEYDCHIRKSRAEGAINYALNWETNFIAFYTWRTIIDNAGNL